MYVLSSQINCKLSPHWLHPQTPRFSPDSFFSVAKHSFVFVMGIPVQPVQTSTCGPINKWLQPTIMPYLHTYWYWRTTRRTIAIVSLAYQAILTSVQYIPEIVKTEGTCYARKTNLPHKRMSTFYVNLPIPSCQI